MEEKLLVVIQIAPLIPPIIIIFCQNKGTLSFVNLFTNARMGYVNNALPINTTTKTKSIRGISWPMLIMFMVTPRKRKAKELAKKVAISQKLDTVSLDNFFAH